MKSQLKKGVLGMCVLSLLEKEDMYGYQLVEEISKNIEITEGTIYPLLRRLKDDNLVEIYLKESDNGPARKYYRLTSEGIAEKNRQVEEYRNFINSVKNILED